MTIGLSANSQDQVIIDLQEQHKYHILSTEEKLKLDGKLDEATWQAAEVGGNFWQKSPYYAENADPKTEIRLAYDDKFLYVGAICYQTEPVTIFSLKRDEYWDNDGIAIVLDPLNTKINSVLFGTSAVGVQYDATRTPVSETTSDWSNKWYVETHITDTYWSAEFAIPFAILRYNQSLDIWGMNFVRNIRHANEYHNWTAVPEGFWPPDAAFTGALIWDKPPAKQKGNFNLIPYVTTGLTKMKGSIQQLDYDLGLDAKVAVSSTLNLDLTYNPDFSQIESDELVTNLTRFNIQLPEKRTFFLENADVFADFGSGGIRPFFSRRIGLNSSLQAVPILYGARVTGNINKDVRVGIMNIHSRSSENSYAQNQSAMSVKKQFGRSYIQGLFLNRQAFSGTETVDGDYGRNFSLEAVYQSDDGQMQVWGAAHTSFKEGFDDNNMVYNTGAKFRNSNWTFVADMTMFQENYFADMGFIARVNNFDAVRDTIIRVGFNSGYAYAEYQFRPRSGYFNRHQFNVENVTFVNDDWSFNESNTELRYFLSTVNTESVSLSYIHNETELLFPFSFTGQEPLPAERYNTDAVRLSAESDERKALSLNASIQTGGFYNGRLTSLQAGANFRVQPWGNFSLGYQWNDLAFPDPYGQSQIAALVSKIEIGFNRNLLWTSLLQYVDQSDFIGINSRLQWRFAPMSDIFLIYVDNYDIDYLTPNRRSLISNNRALVLKVSYWY
jgi:hypothetical protein